MKETLTGRRKLTSNDLFEIFDSSTLLEDVVETRDLNKPTNVIREKFVFDDPLGKFVPLLRIPEECEKVSPHTLTNTI